MKQRRLPFKSVRIDQDDVPVIEQQLGRHPQGYGIGGQQRAGTIFIDTRQRYADMLSAVLDEAAHEFWRRTPLADKFSVRDEEFIIHELLPFVKSFLIENPTWVTEYLNARSRG